jgi:hypothetical protein
LRSEHLILNKKGNEKYPVFSQKGKDKDRWKLIVTDLDGRNRGKKMRRYSDAKKAIAKLRAKHPDFEYTIVSRQRGYGPPPKVTDDYLLERNHRGEYWCPFCRKFRVFDWDPYWQCSRCPVCRIFDYNFHVLVNNPLLADKVWS